MFQTRGIGEINKQQRRKKEENVSSSAYAIEHSMSEASYRQSSSKFDQSDADVSGNYSVESILQLSPFTQSITSIFPFLDDRIASVFSSSSTVKV